MASDGKDGSAKTGEIILFGNPVQTYLAFEVGADEIEDAVKAIRTLKMRGSNVSMQNKTLVGEYLDELSPAAELCGAVNTLSLIHI